MKEKIKTNLYSSKKYREGDGYDKCVRDKWTNFLLHKRG